MAPSESLNSHQQEAFTEVACSALTSEPDRKLT